MSLTSVAPDQPGQLETLAGLVAARLRDMHILQDDRWLDRQAVMAYSGLKASAISRAFAGPDDMARLHSHRLGERGYPRTKRAVVDAWISGATEEQQRQVCGCDRIHRWNPT